MSPATLFKGSKIVFDAMAIINFHGLVMLDKLIGWRDSGASGYLQRSKKHDVEFSGDVEKGYAKGKGFHVEYVVLGESCTLTVTKKPMLIPWSLVEHQLEKLFNE